MAVGLGEQGLGDVEQVEADGGVLEPGGDEADQAGLQVAGAGAQGDDVDAQDGRERQCGHRDK